MRKNSRMSFRCSAQVRRAVEAEAKACRRSAGSWLALHLEWFFRGSGRIKVDRPQTPRKRAGAAPHKVGPQAPKRAPRASVALLGPARAARRGRGSRREVNDDPIGIHSMVEGNR